MLLKVASFVVFFLLVEGAPKNYNIAIHSRFRREFGRPYGGLYPGPQYGGGVLASGKNSGRLSSSSVGLSQSQVSGGDFLNAEKLSKHSSSKSSSSDSNKSSRIKTATTFGGAGSSVNQEGYGASNTGQLNFAANKGFSIGGLSPFGGLNVGSQVSLGITNQNQIQGSKYNANSGFFGGQTNTEIEQSESNHQSQSEIQEAINSSNVNKGSQYAAANQNYNSHNVDAEHDDSFVFAS